MAGITKGTELDRYVVERILGEGGMATVYGVRHRDLGTPYAIKLLKLRVRSLADRLLQEGRIQAALRHPNVVAVTDVLRLDDDIGLVMEFIDGPPLDLLLVNHRLQPAEIDALAADLFDGIEAAHDLGLVHRDLKPANIMIAIRKDHLQGKITDFGLAKAVSEELSVGRATRTGAMMGTPTFMAPEQHRDAKSVDVRADLFSLGLVLYEVIAGTPAITHDTLPDILQQIMQETYRPLREHAPDAPDRWVLAIEACIRADREDRPVDVAALRALWGPPPRPDRWSEATMAAVAHIRDHAPAPPELPEPEVAHLPTRIDPARAGVHATGATLAPSPPPAVVAPIPRASSRRTAPTLGLAALGVTTAIGLVLAGVGATGVAVWAMLPSDAAPVTEATAPPEPAPTAVPPGAAEPLPPEPLPATPSAVPPPAPAPAPERGSPRPAEPPLPAPEAPPAPAPADEPRPVSTGQVVLEGGWTGFLKGGPDRFELGSAPPGTYELWVLFDMQRPSKAGTVVVRQGKATRMRCDDLTTVCAEVTP